jgi:hypothetical protein
MEAEAKIFNSTEMFPDVIWMPSLWDPSKSIHMQSFLSTAAQSSPLLFLYT